MNKSHSWAEVVWDWETLGGLGGDLFLSRSTSRSRRSSRDPSAFFDRTASFSNRFQSDCADRFEYHGEFVVAHGPKILGFPLLHHDEENKIYFCKKLGKRFHTYSTADLPARVTGIGGFSEGKPKLSNYNVVIATIICAD